MKPRHWIATAGALLLAAPIFHTGPEQDIAALERIAPRIERANTLSPEARSAVERLLERVGSAAAHDRREARRKAAVDRVTAALREKDAGYERTGTGQAYPD